MSTDSTTASTATEPLITKLFRSFSPKSTRVQNSMIPSRSSALRRAQRAAAEYSAGVLTALNVTMTNGNSMTTASTVIAARIG